MKEIWKDLIYNGKDFSYQYMISNLGRIKNKNTDTIRTFCLDKSTGYYHLFVKDETGKYVTIKPHRAVAQNFIKNPLNLPCVNHKDGNKINNIVANLEWVDYKQNNIHAVINKLTRSGEASELSKLTCEQIEYIRNNCIPGSSEYGCTALSKKFNVDRSTISKIIHNHSWVNYIDYKNP